MTLLYISGLANTYTGILIKEKQNISFQTQEK